MARKSRGKAPRTRISPSARNALLLEAGYKCANPTCRGMLALDLHHLCKVERGGTNTEGNLVALCPTCHRLHHSGIIPEQALRVWKTMLVAVNQANLTGAVDRLLLISENKAGLPSDDPLQLSGDGIVQYADLIGAGLVQTRFRESSTGIGGLPPFQVFSIELSDKGRLVVSAWKAGQLDELKAALSIRSTMRR